MFSWPLEPSVVRTKRTRTRGSLLCLVEHLNDWNSLKISYWWLTLCLCAPEMRSFNNWSFWVVVTPQIMLATVQLLTKYRVAHYTIQTHYSKNNSYLTTHPLIQLSQYTKFIPNSPLNTRPITEDGMAIRCALPSCAQEMCYHRLGLVISIFTFLVHTVKKYFISCS